MIEIRIHDHVVSSGPSLEGKRKSKQRSIFVQYGSHICLFSPVPHALIYRTKIKASRDLYSVFWCHCFSTGRGPS